MEARNQYILAHFTNDKIVKDSVLMARCKRVMDQLQMGNPAYRPRGINYYIARSAKPDARCYGEGTLFLNMGLFPLVRTD